MYCVLADAVYQMTAGFTGSRKSSVVVSRKRFMFWRMIARSWHTGVGLMPIGCVLFGRQI